jgi:protein-tyrosine phosphatase
MTSKILFLCTGNYYRSRFAEAAFNHYARQHNLPWQAESRGLTQNDWTMGNRGEISAYTLRELQKYNIPPLPARLPQRLQTEEAAQYQRIIAMDEEEHLPYVQAYYPQMQNVEYWHIKDLGDETAQNAMSQLHANVQKLIQSLA